MIALHLLGVRRLVKRPLVVLLSVVGIAGGVALVVAVNGVLASIAGSVDDLAALDADAELTISPRAAAGGFSIDLAERAKLDPDVLEATPAIIQPVLVDGNPVLLVGRPDIPQALAGTGLRIGELVLESQVGQHSISVEARAPGRSGLLNGGQVLLVPFEDAVSVAGRQPDRADSAALVVRTGTDSAVSARLNDVLGPSAYVDSADAPREFALMQMQQVQQPMTLMATIAFLAGGFLVFNTIQSSARQRERELALMRALGATRRQVAVGLLLEAAALGAVGSLLGLLGGLVLGRSIVGFLPPLVEAVAGTAIRYHPDPLAVPVAIASGLGVALVSAILPIRGVFKKKPNHVLARRPMVRSAAGLKPVTSLFGIALVVTGSWMIRYDAIEIAQNGVALVLLGLLILGFGVAPLLAAAAGRLAGRMGPIGDLAEADISLSGRRVWSTSAAVFVAVATALAVGGAARNQGTTLAKQFEVAQNSDLWVSTTEADDLPLDYRFPIGAGAQLGAIDGIQRVTSTTTSYAVQGGERFIVLSTDGDYNAPVVQEADVDAIDKMMNSPSAIVTIQLARTFGLEVGDTMAFEGMNGPVDLEIAAVTKVTTISISGAAVMSHQSFEAIYGPLGPDGFQIFVDGESTNLPRLAQEVDASLQGLGAPVVVATSDQWIQSVLRSVQDATNVFLIVSSAVIAVAGIATLNATTASVVERRRQLGLLRSVGATAKQIRRLVITEVAAAGAVGTAIGVPAGMIMHWVSVFVTNNATPFPQDYSFSWPALIQAALSAAFAIGIGAIIPAWQNSRHSIAEALAYE